MSRRFDALLFDAGGVLVLPDPTVLGPLLAYYGGDPSIDAHRRAHYAGMTAKASAGAIEADWIVYDEAYVRSVGVDEPDVTEAAALLGKTRHAPLWRWSIPESRDRARSPRRGGGADGCRVERQRADRRSARPRDLPGG